MTVELDREAIDEFLRSAGTGVLSLTDGAETYAIPESFGYDGETLYFQFVSGEDSRKMAYLGTTEVATFTAYTESPPVSVVVRGRIERVPDDEGALAANAIAENAVIPTLNVVPGTDLADLSFAYYRLVPTERTGRRFDRFDAD